MSKPRDAKAFLTYFAVGIYFLTSVQQLLQATKVQKNSYL